MADPKQIADALAQDQLLAQFNRGEGQAQPWYMKPMDMEGRATFLPFKDTLPGSVMNQRELALSGLLAGAVNAFTAPSRVSTQGFDAPEEAQNLAMNVMGGGITTGKMMRNPTGVGGTDLALNVYHGTPHEIKGGFDLAKVGTGEGAQSYGHGIYFAESPGVAKSYAQNLADYQINPEYLAAQKRQQDFSETLAKRYKIDALIPSEEVKFNPEHEKKFMLYDNIGVTMRYPSFKEMSNLEVLMTDDIIFDLFTSCIENVFDDNKVYTEYTKEEMDEFVLSLPRECVGKIKKFFDTMPVLEHKQTIKYKDGTAEEIMLSGLKDFFIF